MPTSIRQYFCYACCLLVIFLSSTSTWAEIDDSGLEDNRTFHVFADVDLISTLKFEYGKPKIIIKSVYPQLASETNREGVTIFNDLVSEMLHGQIALFREQVKGLLPLQSKFAKNKITNNLYIDYSTAYINANKTHLISIRFSIKGKMTGAGRAYRHHLTLNYDLDNAKTIELSDLFLPDANYLTVLSNHAKAILEKKLANKNKIDTGVAPIKENFDNWNINPDGILITFKEGQVAPIEFGAQTILIPYSALSDIAAPNTLVSYCLAHHSRCLRSNLLTGGGR